ncbi:DsbA family protein [Luminiphilus sp.]|jgi:2-hydroxychromene-2-carboxylate isomerase|nr:DsbA family protein [Luminiphilus sp.]MDB2313191.1 DsbA family protein [Luminiphilus sp.]MDB2440427.1 DsbA family protein [Luminiphilus sp.]
MDVLKSNRPLIVYLDVKSPYAFVSVKPTLALEQELGLQFDWRPYTLDIPSYLGSARKEKGKVVESSGRSPKIWNAIRYAYMDARRYAELQGYTLKGTDKIWDSSLANMGILFVNLHFRDRIPDYLEAVFPPFWRRELDIEDINVIKDCLKTAGVDSSDFQTFVSRAGKQMHDHILDHRFEAGIYGVPTYVLGNDVFFGREHLPYIRWVLSGKQGQAPDIANEVFE